MFLSPSLRFSGVLSLTLFAAVVTAQTRPVMTRQMPDVVRDGQAQALGALEGTQHLQLALSLPLRDEAALDALLVDIYDPASPNFHHYLQADEFTARFAPTQADYDAVVAWAEAKGLTVTATAPNRRVVDVDGTVNAISHAFHVNLRRYNDPERTGRTFHAPDREPVMDLAVPLLAISGLDTVHPKTSHLRRIALAGTTNATGLETAAADETTPLVPHITGSGPGNTYLPSDMRAAYYGSGPLTGAGQTVAIFSYDGYKTSDLSLYYANTGMTSSVPVTNVLVNGYNGACFGFTSTGAIDYSTCYDGEQILDIVNVIGMAPGLAQVLFYEGNSSTDVLNKMATDNIAKVITSSWGGGDFGTASTPIFKQMAAQGQTYLNATGDSGQFNSRTYTPPSLDANITQVGGTDLTTTGAAGPWASETGWAYSGGGFLAGVAIPAYQQLAGVINASNKGSTTYRNAPDVAAEADFDNTTVNNGTFSAGYGGTSFAAPRWAGFIALANQQAIANGKGPLGFLNPSVYSIGTGSAYTTNFHDITSGVNKPTSGTGTGFNAVTGFDLVTGWGSPTPAFIATLAGPAANFSLSAAPSSLTLAPGAAGSSTTLTVAPTNGFAGAVSLAVSGLPTGVTATLSAASTTSTSSLQLKAASNATAGSYTVTLTGTSGSLVHTATLALTVSAPAWTRVAFEGNTVFLPKGTTYRFGTDTRFLAPVTTTADLTVGVTWSTLGGDPAPGYLKELDIVGDAAGVLVNGQPYGSTPIFWTKVATEGDTVFLPKGITYRFGTDVRYLPAATTAADWTVGVTWSTLGGDPAPGYQKELDVAGDGVGVIVNGVPFKSPIVWTKVAVEGDTVFLPGGTTYRFGIDTRFLPAATTTGSWTVNVTWSTLGGDPAPYYQKELDVAGDGTGVFVNGVRFK